MKYNLTQKQRECIQWLVAKVRNAALTESFEVRESAQGSGLELWCVPRQGGKALEFPFTRGDLDALDASRLVVTRIIEGSTSPGGPSHLPTRKFELHRQCTLTGLALTAVDTDFKEEATVQPGKRRNSKKAIDNEPTKQATNRQLITVILTTATLVGGTVVGLYEKIRVPALNSQISLRDDRIKELEAKSPSDKKAGERVPKLQAELRDGSLVDARTIQLQLIEGHWTLSGIQIANRGNRRSDPITLSLSFAAKVTTEAVGWIETTQINPEFPTRLNLQSGASSIDQEELYPLPPIRITGADLSKPIVCQIDAFYGGEKSLRFRFSIARP